MNTTKSFSISDITIDDSLNIRSGELSQAKIAEYAGCFKLLPPVSLFKVGSAHYLVDGWHRLGAARVLSLADLTCNVIGEGTLDDARDAADTANLKHGIALTPDQRKAVCRRFIERHLDWSSREIAKIIGVSHDTVCRWIKEWSVRNLTDEGKPDRTSASASKRAGGVDIKAVVLKWRQWVGRIDTTKLTTQHRERIKAELAPIVEWYGSL